MEELSHAIHDRFASAAMPPESQLLRAIRSRNFQWAQAVLGSGVDLNGPRILGKSFLCHAGETGDRRMCELLVRHGSDPNEFNGKHQYSLLHHAVASSNYAFASILLSLDAKVDARTSYQATPLHFAARLALEYLAIRLLEQRADIDALDHRDMTPLEYAMRRGQVGMSKFLIKRHCRVVSLQSNEVPEKVAELVAECAGASPSPS